MAGIYYFSDTDKTGEAEYDLSGEEYRVFLVTCMKYSKYFSFRYFDGQIEFPEMLLEFKVDPKDVRIDYNGGDRYKYITSGSPIPYDAVKPLGFDEEPFAVSDTTLYLELTEEVKEWIFSVTDSLFKWIDGWEYKNPEDPMFYRADGSVLFESVIHEGGVRLIVEPGEDFSEVLSDPLWKVEEVWPF